VTEAELIKGCIRENKASQEALYKLYAGKMFTVCMRYARTRMEGEDMLQDGFIKVFDNISKYQFSGSFEGWIRRIMINTALRYYSKLSFKNEQIGIENLEEGSERASALDLLSEKELIAMIASLPDGYRVVFNLYVFEGYSHKEIAEKLNITESTSRSQLVKARKALQQKINQAEGQNYERIA
jgi:RNA polymerase sigma factor (sigma-70 family)